MTIAGALLAEEEAVRPQQRRPGAPPGRAGAAVKLLIDVTFDEQRGYVGTAWVRSPSWRCR